jgi:peptidoglycan L-alanyl-D-glutamate endopeptidase CwlK
MPKFSKRSLELLEQCHPDLQLLCNTAINVIDFSVLPSTIRTLKEQAEFVTAGTSKTMDSLHLKRPFPECFNAEYSAAVDIAPYPIDWNDRTRFELLAGIMKGIAEVYYKEGRISHRIAWGGDWKTLNDMPHFELILD